MAVSLTLLPADYSSKTCGISKDILSLDNDCILFDLIVDISKEKGIDIMRGGIRSYIGEDESGNFEGPCYGNTEIDPYGKRIKSLLASELMEIFSEYKTDSWKNSAIFAFIGELPSDLPIYLYWN